MLENAAAETKDLALAHKWFDDQFGEVMAGRSFSDKCAIATDIQKHRNLNAERDGRKLEALQEEARGLWDKLKHTEYWYSTRWQQLHDWFRSDEMKGTKAANDWFSIIANGSRMTDPPTYAQQFNTMKHRMEAAEKCLVGILAAIHGDGGDTDGSVGRKDPITKALDTLAGMRVDIAKLKEAEAEMERLKYQVTVLEVELHRKNAALAGRVPLKEKFYTTTKTMDLNAAGWYMVYPGSEKLDLGPKKPVAIFEKESHALKFINTLWPGIGYAEKLPPAEDGK